MLDQTAITIANFEELLQHPNLSDNARRHAYYFASKVNLKTAIYYMKTVLAGVERHKQGHKAGFNLSFTTC